jgi:carbon monoxide dehydrogenase subunit G
MAEAEYSTTAALPIETIWEFVREMDNWAPMLSGYQQHEKENENDSVWTLKGDVGVLARIVKFRVRVIEWAGPERVTFQLEGLNELMSGDGEFRMRPADEPAREGDRPAVRKGLFRRLVEAIFRFFFRLRHGRTERERPAAGAGGTRLTFRLCVNPGGPMAPMVNAMMQPAMLPAAEDLAEKIMAHLERRSREES